MSATNYNPARKGQAFNQEPPLVDGRAITEEDNEAAEARLVDLIELTKENLED